MASKFASAFLLILSIMKLSAQTVDQNSFDVKMDLLSPYFVAFDDLNGDGIQDMVGVNGNSVFTIDLYLGNGDFTFTFHSSLQGDNEYYEIYLNDFNQDDFPDIIAVSNIGSKIFISDGILSYQAVTVGDQSPIPSPHSTVFGDFNEDGLTDMIFNRKPHLSNGDGTFSIIPSTLYGNGSISKIDFNKDGDMDLVVANPGQGTIDFYLGSGDGGFSSDPYKLLNTEVEFIKVFDFNQDGLDDIIANEFIEDEFIIYFNDSLHAFINSDTLELNHNFFSVLELGDLDFDGAIDVIGSNDADLFYWKINSDGSFGDQHVFDTGFGGIRQVQLANASGEEFTDLIVSTGFGRITVFCDKLNATISQTSSSKVYDGLLFDNFFETSVVVDSVMAEFPVAVGEYAVELVIEDEIYEGSDTFTISITPRLLEVFVADTVSLTGEEIPAFRLYYENFAAGESAENLTVLPVASTEATIESPAGEYEIAISGGQALNYSFEYHAGTLTLETPLGFRNSFFSAYPNPTLGEIRILSNSQIEYITLTDLQGKSIYLTHTNGFINLDHLESNLYFLKVFFLDGSFEEIKVLKN